MGKTTATERIRVEKYPVIQAGRLDTMSVVLDWRHICKRLIKENGLNFTRDDAETWARLHGNGSKRRVFGIGSSDLHFVVTGTPSSSYGIPPYVDSQSQQKLQDLEARLEAEKKAREELEKNAKDELLHGEF